MQLYHRVLGKGSPIMVLHGLYGSSDNWMSVAKLLASSFRVVLVDLRNHGRSPHHQEHSYSAMANDIMVLTKELGIHRMALLGHSMGGKVAMRVAAVNPELVSKLVVVDIAPYDYSEAFPGGEGIIAEHQSIIRAMQSLYLPTITSRKQAESHLEQFIDSRSVRRFLLKNLARGDSGQFKWKLNVNAISSGLLGVMQNPLSQSDNHPVGCPTLFIRGQNSPYLSDEVSTTLPEFFKTYELKTIANASHWVHVEQPEEFQDTILNFLEG